MAEKTVPSIDRARGLADGLAGKKLAGNEGHEYVAGHEYACGLLRGRADGLAGRFPDGAQSEAWNEGYALGQKQRREA